MGDFGYISGIGTCWGPDADPITNDTEFGRKKHDSIKIGMAESGIKRCV
jgi:hypothetical protein